MLDKNTAAIALIITLALALVAFVRSGKTPEHFRSDYPAYDTASPGPSEAWDRYHTENRRRNKAQSGAMDKAPIWDATSHVRGN